MNHTVNPQSNSAALDFQELVSLWTLSNHEDSWARIDQLAANIAAAAASGSVIVGEVASESFYRYEPLSDLLGQYGVEITNNPRSGDRAYLIVRVRVEFPGEFNGSFVIPWRAAA